MADGYSAMPLWLKQVRKAAPFCVAGGDGSFKLEARTPYRGGDGMRLYVAEPAGDYAAAESAIGSRMSRPSHEYVRLVGWYGLYALSTLVLCYFGAVLVWFTFTPAWPFTVLAVIIGAIVVTMDRALSLEPWRQLAAVYGSSRKLSGMMYRGYFGTLSGRKYFLTVVVHGEYLGLMVHPMTRFACRHVAIPWRCVRLATSSGNGLSIVLDETTPPAVTVTLPAAIVRTCSGPQSSIDE